MTDARNRIYKLMCEARARRDEAWEIEHSVKQSHPKKQAYTHTREIWHVRYMAYKDALNTL